MPNGEYMIIYRRSHSWVKEYAAKSIFVRQGKKTSPFQ